MPDIFIVELLPTQYKKEDITNLLLQPHTSLVMSSIIFYKMLLTKIQMIITYPNYKSVHHLIQTDIISYSEFTKILHRFELQSCCGGRHPTSIYLPNKHDSSSANTLKSFRYLQYVRPLCPCTNPIYH